MTSQQIRHAADLVLIAWIAGSIAIIPTLAVAAWVRDRLAPAARRYWWRATRRHRRLTVWQVVRQQRQTVEVAAAADNTDELDALLAMEQEIHHWQQEQRANRPYNWEAEGDY